MKKLREGWGWIAARSRQVLARQRARGHLKSWIQNPAVLLKPGGGNFGCQFHVSTPSILTSRVIPSEVEGSAVKALVTRGQRNRSLDFARDDMAVWCFEIGGDYAANF